MAATDILASLCPTCSPIFEGEWVEKAKLEPIATASDSSFTKPPSDISEDGLSDSAVSDSEEMTSEMDVEWYENPDWVKKVVGTNTCTATLENATTISYISPLHHSIVDLDYSSISGCHLCAVLNEIVAGRLDEIDEDDVARAVGIVIVRGSSELSEMKESIVLAISYFIDGAIEQDAYLFSIEVQLLPYQVEERKCDMTPGVERSTRPVKDASLRHIKDWLLTCTTDHNDCSLLTSANDRLPTRLLKVQQGATHPEVYICETTLLPSPTEYLALSHCWGRTPIIRLLKNNYDEFRQNISFSALSKTFQDAVRFTLELGEQFIWIDSLCIIQDSPEDWQFEASLMCSVYSNALVTLAATASQDGSGGLFRNASLCSPWSCILEATWIGHTPGTYICVDENTWDRRVVKGPLNTRGWVLQESILSPRIIHFANDQIWWSCAEMDPSCNESFPNGVIAQDTMNLTTNFNPLPVIRSVMPDLLACNKAWLNVVGTYTKRALSFGSDKLVALAGIAEACALIMKVPKESYLAGFWRSDLTVDLLWRMLGNGRRPTSYRAPSWSWASVDGSILFRSSDVREQIRENLKARVVEAEVTPVGDPLGAVSGGKIVVEGPLLKAKLSNPDIKNPEDAILEKLDISGHCFISDVGFTEVLDDNLLYQSWPQDGKDIYFACLTSTSEPEGDDYISEGLILEREASAGVFQRIGWMKVFHPLPFDSMFPRRVGDEPFEHSHLQIGEETTARYQVV